MNTKHEVRICKWSLLIGCHVSLSVEPTNSMCTACVLGWMDTALKREDLAGAGLHLQVLSEILKKAKVVSDTDFRLVFESVIQDKGGEYRA